jgi:hypothetical protein
MLSDLDLFVLSSMRTVIIFLAAIIVSISFFCTARNVVYNINSNCLTVKNTTNGNAICPL